MSEKLTPETISYAAALAALEPATRFVTAFQDVHKVVAAGASLQQAVSETERVLAERRAEIDGVASEIARANEAHDRLKAEIETETREAVQSRDQVRAEIAELESTRDARSTELQQVENKLEAIRAKARALAT